MQLSLVQPLGNWFSGAVSAAVPVPVTFVTNVSAETLSAALVSQLHRQRWQIERFFRGVKCIVGCGHWLAESGRGVTIQIYRALIAAPLLPLYSGAIEGSVTAWSFEHGSADQFVG